LAGLRIGYAIGPPRLIRDLDRVREPFNVNRLAQVAAVAALQDLDHRERTRTVVREERDFLTNEYRRRGFRPVPTQANFILVAVGPEASAIRDRMLKEGVLVREGNAVGFPGHLRVTVGTREQNMKMLQALDRARG
ncbi:MAG: aminotransferase class I/II-fold pyridoxal phosphate-dependent enzyme, partial [Candidatus Rokubacteria bacterium]|nr:aminotransferase class I/II-fold pyridoxal phosphate-dependent enzyme [Candidatus Rokubacteria bacterium]